MRHRSVIRVAPLWFGTIGDRPGPAGSACDSCAVDFETYGDSSGTIDRRGRYLHTREVWKQTILIEWTTCGLRM